MSAATGTFHEQLHQTYTAGEYDNWRVWAGAVSIKIDGFRFASHLARAYVHPDRVAKARVRCEIFVADLDAATLREGELTARLTTNAMISGHIPMHLCRGPEGPELCGANLVFESEPFQLQQTGAYTYSVEVSADQGPTPEWIPIRDIAPNPDGVIVVSPGWVAAAPTVTEVCLRKVDASFDSSDPEAGATFRSGRIGYLTARLQQFSTDVIYLLPFFRPGYTDQYTGEDVRKGTLGSVYAVADFYQIDPELVTPPEQVDLAAMMESRLLQPRDVADVWARVAEGPAAPTLAELVQAGGADAARRWGRDRLVQLIGRAELRNLCQRARALGKRVIFDLVLMQTSRDSELITQHPEWYALDEQGQPRIHQIAWLVYSDVALFDLTGNQALQDYLVEVALYWMACCELDGVRLDASQTVDRPFLMRLKNCIQQQNSEALVLGETLCPLEEAIDIPVDMVYALLVDFHRDAEQATQLIDFLEQVHGTFAAGTVAMAYFENHDSPRATQVWSERFANALEADHALARSWRRRLPMGCDQPAQWMALLKNLQASLINATAGMWPKAEPIQAEGRPECTGGTQLAWAIEWGSEWGERVRTDFENNTLLDPDEGHVQPGKQLVAAYRRLADASAQWAEIRRGQVYYHRNANAGSDAEDRVLAYTRYLDSSAILIVHNLDIERVRWMTIPVDWLPFQATSIEFLHDSYREMGLSVAESAPDSTQQGLRIGLAPLQTCLFRLAAGATL